MTSSFESFNYSQEFLVVSFVTNLYRNHFPREKDYGVPLVQLWGELAKDSTYSIAESIYFNPNIAF